MGWGDILGGVTSIIGGVQGNNAADDQAEAAQAGLDFQRGVYNDAQGNLSPYMQYGQGQGGLGGLAALAGGNYDGFMKSPDYLAARQAMQYSGDHGAAARGNVFSGGHQVDMAQKQGDLASGFLNNYRNSLQWGAGLGQQSAMGLGGLGQSAAGNMMQGFGNLGQAQAQGRGATAGMWGGLLGGLGNWAGGTGSTTSVYGGGSNAGSYGLPAPNAPTPGWRWG